MRKIRNIVIITFVALFFHNGIKRLAASDKSMTWLERKIENILHS